MSEVSVALGALRAAADHLDGAADRLSEISWPTIEPAALAGAAVSVAATSARASAHMSDVIAEMRDWAVAARSVAAEFERAELAQRPRPAHVVTRPSLSQAEAWRPDELRRLADGWDQTARVLHAHARMAATAVPDAWTGAAADEARSRAHAFCARGEAVARALIMAAVAARDGADQLTAAQREVAAAASTARREAFRVADDGSVVVDGDPSQLLILLSGSDVDVAGDLLDLRAAELSRQLTAALDRLGDADADAAHDVDEAFEGTSAQLPVATVPAGAHQSLANVPWDVRIADNRSAIAQAILDESPDERNAKQRIAFYQSLLGEVDDPAGTGQRVDRQILAFDPDREILIELNGDLRVAKSVAVLVPGMNTTIEGSAANTKTARQFVTATRARSRRSPSSVGRSRKTSTWRSRSRRPPTRNSPLTWRLGSSHSAGTWTASSIPRVGRSR